MSIDEVPMCPKCATKWRSVYRVPPYGRGCRWCIPSLTDDVPPPPRVARSNAARRSTAIACADWLAAGKPSGTGFAHATLIAVAAFDPRPPRPPERLQMTGTVMTINCPKCHIARRQLFTVEIHGTGCRWCLLPLVADDEAGTHDDAVLLAMCNRGEMLAEGLAEGLDAHPALTPAGPRLYVNGTPRPHKSRAKR